MSKTENGTIKFSGLAVDVVEWLKRRFNITYVRASLEVMKTIISHVFFQLFVRCRESNRNEDPWIRDCVNGSIN